MREIVRQTLEGMDAGERAEAAEELRRLIAAGRAEDAAGREAECGAGATGACVLSTRFE